VLAWKILRERAASAEELALAERAATQARELRPDDATVLDAWAAAQFRLGRLEAAIEAGRQVLRAQPGVGIFAEHLGRYLQAALAARGAVALGDAPRGRSRSRCARRRRDPPRASR